jgi:hypothetical protein
MNSNPVPYLLFPIQKGLEASRVNLIQRKLLFQIYRAGEAEKLI